VKTSIAVLVLLVLAAGTVYTQSPSVSPDNMPRLPIVNEQNLLPAVPQPPAQRSTPKTQTIEQLREEIEQVRAQKMELEKREKPLALEVRKLLDKQTERLNRLGLGAPIPPPPVADVAPAFAPLTPAALPSIKR
jgi:hypothetical protein